MLGPPPESAEGTVVAACLVDDLAVPSRFLAARRSYPPAEAGRWEFPGGKAEPGESCSDALRRELLEELGVAVTLREEIADPSGSWFLPGGRRIRLWWALAEGDPQPSGAHDALAWVDAADASGLDWLPADRPLVERVLRLMGR